MGIGLFNLVFDWLTVFSSTLHRQGNLLISCSLCPISTVFVSFNLILDCFNHFISTYHHQQSHSYLLFYGFDFDRVWHMQLGFQLSYIFLVPPTTARELILDSASWARFQRCIAHSNGFLIELQFLFQPSTSKVCIVISGCMGPISTGFVSSSLVFDCLTVGINPRSSFCYILFLLNFNMNRYFNHSRFV